MAEPTVAVTHVGEVVVVQIVCKKLLMKDDLRQFRLDLEKLLVGREQPRTVLDFDGVEFLASDALQSLINLQKKTEQAGGRLQLCTIRPEIYEVFTITKLSKMFNISTCREESLRAIDVAVAT